MTRDDSRSSPDPAHADELLRHAAWLRALARTLVGEADADDVVQETWVAAVARRPSAVHSLRAWLGAVARNVVRQSARAAARRRERETVAARRDDAPSTDEVVARAARMRELVERVLALDEPYRSTILLRFFEGVKPQEIARRVGASEEAVRQRLKRGLDRLREQLDAEHGGERERWIAGLAPLTAVHGAPVAVTSGGMVAKGVLMSTPARVAVAGLILAVAASVAVWFPRSRFASDGPKTANAEHVSTATSDAPIATTSDGRANAPQRVPVDNGSDRAAAATAEEAGGPVRFVYGAVVDESGLALDDVRIALWTVGSSDVAAPSAKSPWSLGGRDGVWSTAGITPGIWHVEAQREGFSTLSRDFTIDDASDGHRVDLVLKRALVIPVRFRAPKGGPLADAMAAEASDGLLHNIAVSGFPRAPPARFEVGFVDAGQLDGAGRWFARTRSPYSVALESKVAILSDSDGVLVVEGEPPAFVVATLKHVILASVRIGDAARGVDLVVDPETIRASLATLRLRFVDAETKQPLEGVEVDVHDDLAWSRTAARTDADGCATCTRVLPGLLQIQPSLFGYEVCRVPFPVEAGATADVGTIELSREVTLHGRVRRADGKPAGGWLSHCSLDRWHHGLPVDSDHFWGLKADGSFELSGLGRGRYLVRYGEGDVATPPQIVDTRRDPLPELDFESVAGTEVRFEMQPPLPLQMPIFEIDDARGELVSSGRGIYANRLVLGSYSLTAWRGETRLLELSFEVGAAPLTVPIPTVTDPSGFTRERRRAGDADSTSPTSPTIAPKIQGDPIGIVCYGRIVGGDERGLRNAGATFITNHHAWCSSPARDDCFAVAGLGAGRTERRLYSTKGRLPFTDWVDLASAPPLQRRDFCVAPGTQVAIVLVDAATGEALDRVPDSVRTTYEIPRFSVIATKEPPPPSVPVVDPDWNYFAAYGAGRFQWENPDNYWKRGTLDITEPLPVFVSLASGGRVLHTELLAAPVPELRLPVDWNAIRESLGGVRFKLIDAESGEPLAATCVEIVRSNSAPADRNGAVLPFDADGGYERRGIPAGEHELFVTVAGHETIEHEFSLAPGRVTDLGTLVLGRTRVGRGHVVNERGAPVRVTVLRFDSTRAHLPVPMVRNDYLETAADGSFQFVAGRSPFELRVSDDRFAATCIEVDPAHEPVDDVKIVLTSGTPVSIRVVGTDLSRERFVVEDEDGRTVVSRRMTMGACRFTLRPGKYVVSASLNGEELARADFEVGDAPLEVELKP